MSNELPMLTQLHLKSFGLSDYLVKQIFRGLEAIQTISGFKEYAVADVRESVEAKLSNPKTKPESRQKLQKVLDWINGDSNVIKVDFLKNLPPAQRLEVLSKRIEDLEKKEELLSLETDKLLMEANKALKK
ncbi:MAG: hypothetical protein ACKO9I_00185 [Sphaerospermopsis kisseleviana]|jgi:hypothetical protein|uniref:hypothetical protein n=1 Tax=Sphaerospermopsis sp. FACHB-1094 TaxID=2692861 RepID=UPI0016820A3B|nr:hypothetical protein [Sphaerospermopsis sp. FACHB-1094]MBD2133629.1 hypothetical protein [Sphaerospermopsis sp. FACHB-1094]